MSCTARGTFYLQRHTPLAGPMRTGAFGLTLYVNTDTTGGGREAYAALWKGADAEAFWRANRDRLKAGQPVELELCDLRAASVGDRPGHIRSHIAADITSCRLLPRNHEAHPAATTRQAQPA